MDRLDDELQTRTNDPRGIDGAETPRRDHQRDRVENDQCSWRIDEREDPEDQVTGIRLSKQAAIPQRDHVPTGRT